MKNFIYGVVFTIGVGGYGKFMYKKGLRAAKDDTNKKMNDAAERLQNLADELEATIYGEEEA